VWGRAGYAVGADWRSFSAALFDCRSRTLTDHPVETTLYSLATAAPARPERRSGERYLSLLRVGAISVDGRRELCLIRNISAGGMMIRAYSGIAKGARLSVELKQGEPVAGIVQWTENGLTGIAFDTPIDVIGLLAHGGNGPRPRLPRIEVGSVTWIRQDADVIRARAINISQGGIRIETPAALTPGAEVIVTVSGLAPVPGVVKWNSGNAYGIGFNRPLALAQLVGWLQEQQERKQRRTVAA
jgi:hypothetical protein